MEEILTNVDNSQMGVVLKRMMLRAATAVAKEMDIQALVTGEAIAQVSSQTLHNLAVIDSVTDMLVLRPLIAMDKQDIINIAARIGTEEFAKIFRNTARLFPRTQPPAPSRSVLFTKKRNLISR